MARRVSLKAKRHHVGNAACSCELFMENEGMDWSNAGKGYTQMILREKLLPKSWRRVPARI